MQPNEQAKPQKNAALEKIAAAAQDLLFISETDAPLTPFFWPAPSEEITPEFVKKQANLPAEAEISRQTLAKFFEAATTEEDWMNEDEKAEVQRFQNLQTTLEQTLQNITVFRAGETNITVFIIGQTEGGLAGLQTNVVET